MFFIWSQSTRVTDRQTDRQNYDPQDGAGLLRAVKILQYCIACMVRSLFTHQLQWWRVGGQRGHMHHIFGIHSPSTIAKSSQFILLGVT